MAEKSVLLFDVKPRTELEANLMQVLTLVVAKYGDQFLDNKSIVEIDIEDWFDGSEYILQAEEDTGTIIYSVELPDTSRFIHHDEND